MVMNNVHSHKLPRYGIKKMKNEKDSMDLGLCDVLTCNNNAVVKSRFGWVVCAKHIR